MTALAPARRLLALSAILSLALEFAACATAHESSPPPPPSTLRVEDLQTDGIDLRSGNNLGIVRAHYGVPILQRSLLWDGNGEDDNYGLSFDAFRFVNDGVLLGMSLGTQVWRERSHDVFAAEWDAVLRYYLLQEQRVFFDLGGGWVQGAEPVPYGGTDWNMTFSFGPGVDIPIGKRQSLLLGATYHHVSNALGRENDRNPSQNDMRFWIGYGFNF